MSAMANKKAGRQERRATDVRQAQIIDAAMRIIASKGSRKFTAKLLGTEVGVTGGAIFRHFKNMDEIVEAVIGRIEEILFEDFPPKAADPIERLGIFFQNRVRAIVDNPHVSRLLLSDHLAQAGGRAQAKQLGEFKRRSHDFVLKCLREAKESGMLLGGVEPEEGTILVLGGIFSLAHYRTRFFDKKEVERVSARIWNILESLLRGRDMATALLSGTRRFVRLPTITQSHERKLK
jgi:AcrR family transcriptional regulator